MEMEETLTHQDLFNLMLPELAAWSEFYHADYPYMDFEACVIWQFRGDNEKNDDLDFYGWTVSLDFETIPMTVVQSVRTNLAWEGWQDGGDVPEEYRERCQNSLDTFVRKLLLAVSEAFGIDTFTIEPLYAVEGKG